VSTINIQTEVLQLQRQILVAWLPRSELIRGVLLQLPHVTPQVGGCLCGLTRAQPDHMWERVACS
jgi:hypothetical protein